EAVPKRLLRRDRLPVAQEDLRHAFVQEDLGRRLRLRGLARAAEHRQDQRQRGRRTDRGCDAPHRAAAAARPAAPPASPGIRSPRENERANASTTSPLNRVPDISRNRWITYDTSMAF